MKIEEQILQILHDFETFKLTNDEQGVYAKTTSYIPFIDRIKALTIHSVVVPKGTLCDCGSSDFDKLGFCPWCDTDAYSH